MSVKDKAQSVRTQSTADNAIKEVLVSLAETVEALEKQVEAIKASQSKPKKEVKKESE